MSLPVSFVLWGLVQMALFWAEARGSLGKNLKEGCGWGFEAGERVDSLEGPLVTKFSPPALPPGGETSASFKGRRTVRVGAVPPSLGAAPWFQFPPVRSGVLC